MHKATAIIVLLATVALGLFPSLTAHAQVVPAQNQVTSGPYGGLVYATSTSPTAKLYQLFGAVFGDIALWNGSKWTAAATSTLGLQAPITLTTTGTSGAATFIANTLNIPQYATAPGGLNLQVQYNNAGVFGGISGAVTNGTILNLTNPLIGGGTLTTSTVNGVTLTTGGSATTYLDATGAYSIPASGGGSGGGTWSTTTSSVPGQLINYSNNNSDIVTVGSTSTSTAPVWFDPNSLINYFKGRLGIGTTSPSSLLNVSGADTGTTLTAASVAMADITNTSSTNNSFSDLTFSTNDTNAALPVVSSKIVGIHTSHTAGAISGAMAFLTRNAGTLAERMRILATGEVGINIAAPTSLFHVGGTYTSANTALATINATMASTNASAQYGLLNNVNFSLAQDTAQVVGQYVNPAVAGTGNVANLYGQRIINETVAGYTGTVAQSAGILLSAPVIGSGTNPFTTYWGIFGSAITNGNGTTTGTITNHQARFGGATAGAGFGGTIINYGIRLDQPSGTGQGITQNFGLRIIGAVTDNASTTNWSLYNDSAARSYFASPVSLGDATANATYNLPSALWLATTSVATTSSTQAFRSARVAVVADNMLGGIDFWSDDTNLTAPGIKVAAMQVLANTTHTASVLSSDFVWYSTNVLAYAEKMRLTAAGVLRLPALGTPAGTFLAADPSGNIIATTSPTGGGITSIGPAGQLQTGTTQTLATSTTGTDFTITAASNIQTFNLPTASASNRGALSSADWTTFNGKQAAGNYITALTGDVTASGPGSVAATLATVNGNVGSFTNASFTVNAKGLVTAASSGATPEVPLTFSTGLTRTVNTITVNTSQNISTLSNLTGNGAILTSGGTGALGTYAGTSCTNQFVRSLSGSIVATCATVANTDLANSTISGIALGSNLADLTATDATLSFSGSYNGSTARTIGLNLANANTWTGIPTFSNGFVNNATSTGSSGFNISGGCYAISGVCIGGSPITGTLGQVAYFSGTDTAVGTSTLFITSSKGVGIGTTTPASIYKLHVVNDNLSIPFRSERFTAGTGSGVFVAASIKTSTTASSADGYGGAIQFHLQDASGTEGNLALISAIRNGADNSGTLRLQSYSAGSSNSGITLTANGNVGVASTTPWQSFSVAGTGAWSGLTAATTGNVPLCINATTKLLYEGSTATSCSPSSIRFKEDIADTGGGLAELRKLRPVTFYFKDRKQEPQQQLGFIAEEVTLVDTRLVQKAPDGQLAGLRLDNFMSLVVSSIQQLADKDDDQDAEIAELRREVTELKQSGVSGNRMCRL